MDIRLASLVHEDGFFGGDSGAAEQFLVGRGADGGNDKITVDCVAFGDDDALDASIAFEAQRADLGMHFDVKRFEIFGDEFSRDFAGEFVPGIGGGDEQIDGQAEL